MSLSVFNCPKAKLIDEMVSMVTKQDIPVVRLLIKCLMVKRDTMCPSQSSIASRQNQLMKWSPWLPNRTFLRLDCRELVSM